MIVISMIILLLTACSNIFIPENQNYRSVHLNGNGWIQIPNQNYNCTNDLRVFDDNFTFEIYFSGDNKNTNSAGTIFSLTGKQTENFTSGMMKNLNYHTSGLLIFIKKNSEEHIK